MNGTPDDGSDADLARLALSGADRAYRALTERHREPVYRLVRGMIGDPDEALDLTQETFVAAFGALARYDPQRPFRAWIARIAINKCRDWARRRAVRRMLSFGMAPDVAATLADSDPLADRALAARDELARAAGLLAALPAALKEPLVLRTIEGLSQAETASVLGISEKAVETRLRRARLSLAAQLRALDASGAAGT